MLRRIVVALVLVVVAVPSAKADYAEGREAYSRGDYAAALANWRPLAEQGDARAQLALGFQMANGLGMPQDDGRAAAWYQAAAAQGSTAAQSNLAFMYAAGRGVPQDDGEAAAWYRKAAGQNYAPALNNLGVMYTSGRGVPQDAAKAVEFYRKAAEQDAPEAQFNMGLMYAKGLGVPRDYFQAINWYRRAAERGLAAAARASRKTEERRDALLKSSRRNPDPALAEENFKIARRYIEGDGVDKDYASAALWLTKAAKAGHANARNQLGILYVYGLGVSRDDVIAYLWFKLAADQGHADAQTNLALAAHRMAASQIDEADFHVRAWYAAFGDPPPQRRCRERGSTALAVGGRVAGGGTRFGHAHPGKPSDRGRFEQPARVVMDAAPHALRAKLDAAKGAFDARDYPAAIEIWHEVLETDHQNSEANYYYAILFRQVGDMARSIDYMGRAGLAPGYDHDYVDFQGFASFCREFAKQQAKAMEQRVQPMLISALPKSASAFVSSVLGKVLRAPICRASSGIFPNMAIVPNWLAQMLCGGAVTHDHFAATEHNLTCLRAAGVERLYVHLRDPRQAVLSYIHMEVSRIAVEVNEQRARDEEGAYLAKPLCEQIDLALDTTFVEMVGWIDGWVGARDSLDSGFDIFIGSFEDMSAGKPEYFERLLAWFGDHSRVPLSTAAVIELIERTPQALNFRKGEIEEWRTGFSPEQCRRAWRAIDRRWASNFGWRE